MKVIFNHKNNPINASKIHSNYLLAMEPYFILGISLGSSLIIFFLLSFFRLFFFGPYLPKSISVTDFFDVIFFITISLLEKHNQRTIGPENAHLKPDLGALSQSS